MQSKKDKDLVLINVEGPILKVKRADGGDYVLYDNEDSIVDILNPKKFVDFIFNDSPLIYTNGKEIKYKSYAPKDRANRGELARFMFGGGVGKGFLEFSKIDGQWLSPITEEREWQDEVLKEIFPSYPEAAPRWQYMNGLLQIALRYKEQVEVDHGNSSGEEESEDDENG